MDFFSGFVAGTVALTSGMGLEAEVGANRYTIQPDGTWYQKALPNEIERTTAIFGIGINGPIGKSLRWHLGYVNLGRVHSDANVTEESGKHRYDPFSENGCSGNRCKMVRAVGDGLTQGFQLSIDNATGKQEFIAGAGVFVYRSDWKVHVLHDRGDIRLEHNSKVKAGPMVRFGYAFGNGMDLMYTYYHHPSDRDYSALQRGSHVVSFRMSF